MIIIKHRINSENELKKTPIKYGVEVDIRSYGSDLVLTHDNYVVSEKFEKWLESYEHKFIILNIKEEGLEEKIIEYVEKFKIVNFFFLDQSFPYLRKYSNRIDKKTAIRVSEYESVDTAIRSLSLSNWVWIDCFNKFPLLDKEIISLKSNGFKICIVSPELQERFECYREIDQIIDRFKNLSVDIDAVCTKYCEYWEEKYVS